MSAQNVYVQSPEDPYIISWIMNPYSLNNSLNPINNMLAQLPHGTQQLLNGKINVRVHTSDMNKEDRQFFRSLIDQVSEDVVECSMILDRDHNPRLVIEAQEKIQYLIPRLTGQVVDSVEIYKYTVFARPTASAIVGDLTVKPFINTINANNFLSQQLQRLNLDKLIPTRLTTSYEQVMYKFIPRNIDGSPQTLPSNIMPQINDVCPLTNLLGYRILTVEIGRELEIGDYSLYITYLQDKNISWSQYTTINYREVTLVSNDMPLSVQDELSQSISSLIDSGLVTVVHSSDLDGHQIPLFYELLDLWKMDILYHDRDTDRWLIRHNESVTNWWSQTTSISKWIHDNVLLIARGLLPRHTFSGTWQTYNITQRPLIVSAISQCYSEVPYVVNYDHLIVHPDLSFSCHIAGYDDAYKLYNEIVQRIKHMESWYSIRCNNILQLVGRRWQLWSEKFEMSYGIQVDEGLYLISSKDINSYNWLDESWQRDLTNNMKLFLSDCSPQISATDLSQLLNITYSSSIDNDGKMCVSNEQLDKYQQIIHSIPTHILPLPFDIAFSRYRNAYYGLLGFFDIGSLPGNQPNPPTMERLHPLHGLVTRVSRSTEYSTIQYYQIIINKRELPRPFFSIMLDDIPGRILQEKLQELWNQGIFMTPWSSIFQQRTGLLSYSYRTPYFGLHTGSTNKDFGLLIEQKLLQL